ncbi:uncharacterized protein FIBRA_00668 [Fibroporia radiculosa]|uniref:Uncharacterized protein n=1 Tax=Fibroporia radiculosa TaxID=599839 RepID=J4I824_9APHY|nr:uncharacterized protein FIBRA_00668 [Fibroporia radiculosa]CCL98666.1 predicted protein [Fibroporia radiculosa]
MSQLPQHVDLLERYRGLVALGRIKYDEGQVRAIMQLRRLQRELDGYAPPALTSRYLTVGSNARNTEDSSSRPWWNIGLDNGLSTHATPEHQALIHFRTHAEEIVALTTPKASASHTFSTTT